MSGGTYLNLIGIILMVILKVDYHETPQFPSPVPVKRVRPLELSPGGLMLTDRRLYFQPAQHSGLGEGTQLQVIHFRKSSYSTNS